MAESIVQLHGLDNGSENFALGYTAGLEAGSAATTPVLERKRPAEVLPSNLPPVGGSLEQAAALIDVSPNTFLEMERQGIMSAPVRFGRRRLYDFEAVRAAFKTCNVGVRRTEVRCRSCALKPITHGRTSIMRKRPPFVEFFRDRHGKPRLYFRKDRGMPRIPLPGVVGSPEFNRAYEAALAGRLSDPTLARPAVAAQGTIEALAVRARRSP